MNIGSTSRILALAVAGFLVSFSAIDTADAGARIIKAPGQDNRTHGGRVLHLGGDTAAEQPSVKIIKPRYPKLEGPYWDKLRSEPAVPHEPHHDVHFVPPHHHGKTKTVVINRYFGDLCFSGSSINRRAGDRFQAGGNMLRVPAEEVAFGRRACAKTRVFQRYLGFKRVYKGQVYTGFRKVFSGKRYLTGDY